MIVRLNEEETMDDRLIFVGHLRVSALPNLNDYPETPHLLQEAEKHVEILSDEFNLDDHVLFPYQWLRQNFPSLFLFAWGTSQDFYEDQTYVECDEGRSSPGVRRRPATTSESGENFGVRIQCAGGVFWLLSQEVLKDPDEDLLLQASPYVAIKVGEVMMFRRLLFAMMHILEDGSAEARERELLWWGWEERFRQLEERSVKK